MVGMALEQVEGISQRGERPTAGYLNGLKTAVAAALDHGIDAVERDEARAMPIPTALLAQARLAARHRIGLETIMRRYLAGYTLLGDFLTKEAKAQSDIDNDTLTHLLQGQTSVLDRLIESVSEEYKRELVLQAEYSRRLLLQQVDQLLAGHSLATEAVSYDFEGHHVGIVARGDEPSEHLREIVQPLELRLLHVRRGPEEVWAWLGDKNPIAVADVRAAVTEDSSHQLNIGLGESARGIGGWRLTHQQAEAVMPLLPQLDESCARYADVALLTLAQEDDLLATSLQRIYLEPIERMPAALQLLKSLGAYYGARGNVTSAAAAIGINRKTVLNHLRLAEEAIGCSLVAHGTEIETALRLRAFMTTPGDALAGLKDETGRFCACRTPLTLRGS
jgi:hypothetical protein